MARHLTPRAQKDIVERINTCGIKTEGRRSTDVVADLVRRIQQFEGFAGDDDEEEELLSKSQPKPPMQPKVFRQKFEQNFRGLSGMEKSPHDIVSWVNPEETSFWCMDGRYRNAVLATPGGDAAEFLLALNVFSKCGGSLPSPHSVRSYFAKYIRTRINTHRKFFYHTDAKAMDALRKSFGVQEINMNYPGIQEVQDRLIQLLIKPEYVGCDHMRYILENEREYQTPRLLTQWFISAFFDYYWNKNSYNKLVFAVVEGEHEECAITNFQTQSGFGSKDMAAIKFAPLIRPLTGSVSQYVNHPQHVVGLRRQLARFFAPKLINGVSEEEMVKRMNEVAAQQLFATVNRVVAQREGSISIFTTTFEI